MSNVPSPLHRYLPGGMECCLAENRISPLVAIQLWIKVGSIDEEDSQAGLAHLLEHMVFKGSRDHPESNQIAARLESLGGEIDASTSFDHTLFQVVLPSSELETGLDILFDLVFHPLLPEEELPREKEVVIEEMRRMRDSPGALASLDLFRKLYAGTRLERPIIGSQESVESASPQTVADFHTLWYRPNNAMLVVSGDFCSTSLWEELSRRAEKLKPGPIAQRQAYPIKPHAVENPIALRKGPWQGTRLHFSCPGPALEDPDTPAWHMLVSLLGIGESSRLVREVRDEQGLVPDIDAGIFLPKSPFGLFSISFYAETRNSAKALSSSFRELRRIAERGPSLAEMGRVQASLLASRTYEKESVEGVARSLGHSLLTTRKLNFDDWYEEQLGRVSPKEVQVAAQTVLLRVKEGLFSVAACSREEDTLSTEELMEALSDHQTQNAKALERPEIISSTESPDVKQARVRFAEGGHAHINHRVVPRLPLVSAVLAIPIGMSDGDHASSMHMMSQMLVRGTERQSFQQFVDELEDSASSITAFSTPDSTGIHLNALTCHSPRVLEMALDALLRPAFQAEQWERLKRETMTAVVAQQDSPGLHLRRLVLGLLFGDSHPYGRTALSQIDELEAITLEEVALHHQRLLQQGPLVVGVAGDFQLENVVKTLQDRWTPTAFDSAASRTRSEAPLPTQARTAFHFLEREQAHIAVALRAFPITDPRRTAVELGSTILGGQGGRLFRDLRDERSLAYALGTSHQPGIRGGYFAASMGVAPQKVDEALAGLQMHIQRLAAEPPTPEELLRAKRSLMGSRNIDGQTMHCQASQLSASELFGLGFDNFLRFEQRVNAVTPEMISDSFSEMLQRSPFQIAVVGPKEAER